MNGKRIALGIELGSTWIKAVGTQANAESYNKRNRYMVNHSDCLLAVYDNDRTVRSGTGQTVQYAEKLGKSIILIHPDTGIVSGDTE